jgi:hypothetical protein
VKNIRTHSILIGRKPLKRNCVLTEEKLHDIIDSKILLENLYGD